MPCRCCRTPWRVRETKIAAARAAAADCARDQGRAATERRDEGSIETRGRWPPPPPGVGPWIRNIPGLDYMRKAPADVATPVQKKLAAVLDLSAMPT